MGKGYKDFGKGFYLTGIAEHARRMARRNRHIELARLRELGKKEAVHAYLYEFTLNMDLLEDYSTKIFPADADIKWLDFVLDNRKNSASAHTYDYVSGATANDFTDICFKAYYAGAYGAVGTDKAKHTLLSMLEPDKLPRQHFIRNQALADNLKLVQRAVIS
jgi:hypothetical protein